MYVYVWTFGCNMYNVAVCTMLGVLKATKNIMDDGRLVQQVALSKRQGWKDMEFKE